MPQGLEVYGPAGDLWSSTSDPLGKLVGSISVTPGLAAGTPVRYAAPGAGACADPFAVIVNNNLQNVSAIGTSGGGNMTLHSFACSNALVVPGQDFIDVYGEWSYLADRNCTIWYGSK